MKHDVQLVILHGGKTFRNKREYLQYFSNKTISIEKRSYWYDEYLDREFGDKFKIIRPQLPSRDDAKYKVWELVFSKFIPFFGEETILIGPSLGGTFLAKYLSEHKLPKKVLSVFLVCPPFDNTTPNASLVGGFKLKSNLDLISENCTNLHLLFSKDDDSVPVSHAEKYREKLPNANIVIYDDKNGHFRVDTFPELKQLIETDIETQNK